jgi:hypothetical protein
MQKFLLVYISLLLVITATAQKSDSLLIDALVDNIASLQVKDSSEFYPGMLYAYRQCGGGPHNYQPDNNIFFTAIGAFGLRNLQPYLSPRNKEKTRQVIDKAVTTYPYFRNKYGYPFYNFWPTNAPIMPHTYIFQYLKGVFGQGEDADDAVMVLMSSNAGDSTCRILKQRMIATSNLAKPNRNITTTYKQYRKIPALSTYLGLRMPVDFDFAVQCNLLYFTLDRNLPFTKQDSATLQLLSNMIGEKLYLKAPVYISPYYVKPAVLLYHLTRLMAAFHLPELELYTPQLIIDMQQLLLTSNNIMDKILLSTSLLRLGAYPPPVEITDIPGFEQSNQQQFIFFQARAAFSYPTPFKQVFLHFSYINYYFYCPVYNKILWLEYLVERNKKH